MTFRHFALPLVLSCLSLSVFAQTPDSVEAATLVHSACPSGCPGYSLKIDKQGIVRYDGKGFVKVFGQKTWAIPEASAETLLARLQEFVAGERTGRYLADQGECAVVNSEKQVGVVIEVGGKDEMPIPGCYNAALAKFVEDANAITAASIYTTGHDAEREAAIRAVLDAQVVAWNKGDIDAFMRGYWMSKDLTFFSGGSETHGWTETLERYRKAYKGTGRQMGQLTFGDLRIEMLSPETAFVRGTWKLDMPATKSSNPLTPPAKNPHGLFTLIFRKMPDGWRIIHDSTGSA